MVQAGYRGARGSNAGDDFHELWTLRQALALLDRDTGQTAVTVEGLRAEDESGTPAGTRDGVDCALYYGGDHAASGTRIVVAQLKYSAANPHQPWTVEAAEGRLLGQHLVRELGFEDGVDTVGRWMAHHVAELMDKAENGATAAERSRACKNAMETIFKIWEHLTQPHRATCVDSSATMERAPPVDI